MGDIDLINEAHLPNAAPYALSKATLSTLFAKLGAAYEDEGVLFMSLCPGLVDTASGQPTCKITLWSLVLSEFNADDV